MLDSEGDRFWDPGADTACFDALKNDLRADIPLVEMDANINDPEFAEKLSPCSWRCCGRNHNARPFRRAVPNTTYAKRIRREYPICRSQDRRS